MSGTLCSFGWMNDLNSAYATYTNVVSCIFNAHYVITSRSYFTPFRGASFLHTVTTLYLYCSGVAQAELRSLHMLLKHHLWSAAIVLVQQQDPEVRGHLFEALISAAARVGWIKCLQWLRHNRFLCIKIIATLWNSSVITNRFFCIFWLFLSRL